MHERAVLTLLISGAIMTYAIAIARIEIGFVNLSELKALDREAINIINNLPRELVIREGSECGEYTCIEESALNRAGYRVEVIDLEGKIIWYYGKSEKNLSVSAPALINNRLGRVRVIA